MSDQVGIPVSDAPKPALDLNPPKLSRGWSYVLLVYLLAVQSAWTAALLYAGYRVIGAIGGIF